LLLLAAGVILIRQADAISRRFVGRYVVSMEVVLYRIVLAVMGLYFITVGITNGLTLLNNVVIHYFSDLPDELAIGPRGFWPFALLAGANTGIGLYFFLGAPRLLGWHLKRCREVMSENATEADIAGPGRMDGVGQ